MHFNATLPEIDVTFPSPKRTQGSVSRETFARATVYTSALKIKYEEPNYAVLNVTHMVNYRTDVR